MFPPATVSADQYCKPTAEPAQTQLPVRRLNLMGSTMYTCPQTHQTSDTVRSPSNDDPEVGENTGIQLALQSA